MFINSEKELEDYICNHQEEFIGMLEKQLDLKNIKFLGRQVKIGNDNIADLVYYNVLSKEDNEIHTFKALNYIVVELKFRKGEPKDVAQLSRYINILEEKILIDEEELYEKYDDIIVQGVLLTQGANDDLQEMEMMLADTGFEKITFCYYDIDVKYFQESWTRKEEYLEKVNIKHLIEKIEG